MKPMQIAVLIALGGTMTGAQAQLPDAVRLLNQIFNKNAQQKQPPKAPEAGNEQKPMAANANNEAPRSPYPCLSNLCLNDSISLHMDRLPWRDFSQKAKDAVYTETTEGEVISLAPGKMTVEKPGVTRMVRNNRRDIGWAEDWVRQYVRAATAEDLEKVLPYVILNKADKTFFQLVADRKPVFCRTVGFEAEFMSESGYPTYVAVAPSDTGALKVVYMRRIYPSGDAIQLNAFRSQVNKEFPFIYAPGNQGINVNPPWGSGRASFTPAGALEFTMSSDEFGDARLARQAGCAQPIRSLN